MKKNPIEEFASWYTEEIRRFSQTSQQSLSLDVTKSAKIKAGERKKWHRWRISSRRVRKFNYKKLRGKFKLRSKTTNVPSVIFSPCVRTNFAHRRYIRGKRNVTFPSRDRNFMCITCDFFGSFAVLESCTSVTTKRWYREIRRSDTENFENYRSPR